jgi:predicted regulator of Ras-like GTPase activity (Roadblock/LC7/MglB family)
MTNLVQIVRGQLSRLPEVTALVISDRSGALVEASGDIDGEAAGAVYTVAAEALERAGEQLGLGPLWRASIQGPATACLVAVHEEGVVGIHVDPRKPLGGLEKKLDGVFRR